MFDLIVKDALVIDGSGRPGLRADVGVQGDTIQSIGSLGEAEAAESIDARGRVLAPGFIDVHTHADGWLLKMPNFESKTRQGFTTEVLMADGMSYAPLDQHTARSWFYYLRALNGLRFEDYPGWESIADYMALLDQNTAQNTATHVPYSNIRSMELGWQAQPPNDTQQRRIWAEVEKGLAAGAVGLSSGLDYIGQCFATTDELVNACLPFAGTDALYVTHIRYKSGLVEGVREAVEIGKRANVPVHISHLKGISAEQSEPLLEYINTVARNEVEFSFDVYPYPEVSTMLSAMLPFDIWEQGPLAVLSQLEDPIMRTHFRRELEFIDPNDYQIAWVQGRAHREWQGQPLSAYIESRGRPAADALIDLLIEENLAVLFVGRFGDLNSVHPFIAHDLYMMGSDGIYQNNSVVHPRQYGSATRVLGPWVRDEKIISLEEAVHKMTGFPAARFGLTRRGLIAAGHFADMVLFDPETVSDRATFADPHTYGTGIDMVWVNGQAIVRDGEAIHDLEWPLPGRHLKFQR
jgi:N-acyl-D-amino-acid deacylase